ncbi:MAG: abortive infection family protein, partial [Actinomycetota bacterium]|nr:abortive infection family protein [Actinomycetota bacterium]
MQALLDTGGPTNAIDRVCRGRDTRRATRVRNKASLEHPNKDLLGRDEAELVVNAGRTLLAYLDAKTGSDHERKALLRADVGAFLSTGTLREQHS